MIHAPFGRRALAACFLLVMLASCGDSSSFTQREAERILGAVEAPVGLFVAEIFAHMEGTDSEDSPLVFDTERDFHGEIKVSKTSLLTMEGTVEYEAEVELTPAQVDTRFDMNLNAYPVTGLLLTGTLAVRYQGERQIYSRTITGDITVEGDLEGTLSIDLTVNDSGKHREWTGTLDSHTYDARVMY